MTAFEKVKLTNAGDSLTLSVVKCAPAATGNFPGIEFAGTTADGRAVVLEVPKASTDRQLGRLNLTYESAVGKTLTFSRDPNAAQPTKPYWGINPASAPVIPPPRPAAAKPQGIDLGGPIAGLDEPEPEPPEDAAVPEKAANPARDRLVASFKLYDACMAHALKVKARLPEGTDVDIAAVAATLYIQANR